MAERVVYDPVTQRFTKSDEDSGAEIASMSLSANYALTTAFADVTGWQIVVPANSGPVEVNIPSVLVSIVTGTNAAATTFNAQIRILDEANAVVAFSELKVYSSSATSQTWAQNIIVAGRVANASTAKTYRVQAAMGNVGTNSASAAINTAAVLGTDPILRARRL
jgi:hypothetical protein